MPSTHNAPCAGLTAPDAAHKNEASAGGTARGSRFQQTADTPCAAAERDRVAERDKRVATARARAALAGLGLQTIDRGDGQGEFLLSRWNLHRVLPDIAAVEVWIDRVAGAAR